MEETDDDEEECNEYSIDESKRKISRSKNFDDSSSDFSSKSNKFIRKPTKIDYSFTSSENDEASNNQAFSKNQSKSSLLSIDKNTNLKVAQCRSKEFLFTLCIQMKLCDFTLKHWINSRNTDLHASSIDEKNKFISENNQLYSDLFRQILSGVNYIHSKSIIHRDLKVNKKKFFFIIGF